jgi:hypothetical protein
MFILFLEKNELPISSNPDWVARSDLVTYSDRCDAILPLGCVESVLKRQLSCP